MFCFSNNHSYQNIKDLGSLGNKLTGADLIWDGKKMKIMTSYRQCERYC